MLRWPFRFRRWKLPDMTDDRLFDSSDAEPTVGSRNGLNRPSLTRLPISDRHCFLARGRSDQGSLRCVRRITVHGGSLWRKPDQESHQPTRKYFAGGSSFSGTPPTP